MVERSMSERGFARPGFAAKDGTVLGGNLSVVEVASSLGMDEVIIVESDGTRPIVHMRTDLEPDSDAARMLAIEDNRTAEVSLDWDASELLAAANELDLSKLFTGDELAKITAGAGMGVGESAGVDEIPAQWMVLIECKSEAEQNELLQRFIDEGLQCKALTS
jgi:hypothetical protein